MNGEWEVVNGRPKLHVTIQHSPTAIHSSPLRTWLQLLRAPNLFTVPGDPLAGYLLACYGTVEPVFALPIFASLFFYSSGLLLNDLADLTEDRAERPARPLPSGAASRSAVFAVMLALAACGLVLCRLAGAWPLAVGAVLLIAIASYNLGLKRVPVIGAVNMGLCRGLSLLLGATAVSHGDLTLRLMLRGRLDHVVVAFLLVTLFTAAVTNLARFETKSAVPGFAKWLPAAAIAGGAVSFVPVVNGPNRQSTIALFALAFLLSAQVAWRLTRDPRQPVPPMIGTLIRLLIILQAAFCAAAGDVIGAFFAAMLIVLWPISRAVGKQFYAS